MTEAEAAMWVKIAGQVIGGIVVVTFLLMLFCGDGIEAWLANRGRGRGDK